MYRRLALIGLACVMLAGIVAGCFSRQDSEPVDDASGIILLWHSWNEAEEIVLTQILERFMEINDDATVKIQGFDSVDEMLSEFEAAARSGLGPDLMIAPSSAARPLADADLIRSIENSMSEDETEPFLPSAIQALEVDGDLYGLPTSLSTTVFYYNKNLVDTPPESLSSLLDEAADGRFAAMSNDFEDAFWGIQAFGGQLFDEDGKVVLDRGGFVNWLAWLKTARDLPGVLVDGDATALQERFIEGDVAYYVGSSEDLQNLEDQLGEDVLGVESMPRGPIGLAGPLLGVEGILFSSASSQRQTELAVELANFLTNPEQSGLLMREVQHIPANLGVYINPSLMPTMSRLSFQARNSVTLPDTDEADSILETVAGGHARVIEGLLDPAQAAANVTADINAQLGLEESGADMPSCDSIGVLRIANLLPEAHSSTIDERLRAYSVECPNVVVRSAPTDLDGLYAILSGESTGLGYADLILAPQTAISPLVDDGHIRNVTNLMTPDEMQRFQPKALDAMRYESDIDGDGIYGFPLYSDVNALYVNRDLISDPARNLIDIETQAADGVPIVLEANLENGFWGFGAMGGVVTPGESLGEQNETALLAWLTWLRDMEEDGLIELVDDHELARQKFLDQESAYFVGGASEYRLLKPLADSGSLSISPLPAGSTDAASPFLLTYGSMVSSTATEARATLGADLVRFLTAPVSAEHLAAVDNVVPSNATIDLSRYPSLVPFAEQMSAAVVLPNTPELAELVASFDELFGAVLDDNVSLEEAVAEHFGQILPETPDTSGSGESVTPENGETVGETIGETVDEMVDENVDEAVDDNVDEAGE